eukprot:Mycagemm_TRINITY_DN10071_c0_g1::TRINITY_DN10071_c0_g1_i2::g.2075::m.2075 type:complete len:138 gc:universal TRINITY_DN10071_c0_g1_i2:1015-602(-)
MKVIALLEVRNDALHIAIEIHLCIVVRGGDHLREIDHRDVLLVIHEEIELIEVGVNQAVRSHLSDQLHQSIEQLAWVSKLRHLCQRVALDPPHDDAMSANIHWLWDGEAVFIEGLHIGVLLQRGKSREVQPRCTLSV